MVLVLVYFDVGRLRLGWGSDYSILMLSYYVVFLRGIKSSCNSCVGNIFTYGFFFIRRLEF